MLVKILFRSTCDKSNMFGGSEVKEETRKMVNDHYLCTKLGIE